MVHMEDDGSAWRALEYGTSVQMRMSLQKCIWQYLDLA